MNNFEIHEKTTEMVDTLSHYCCARIAVEQQVEIEKLKETIRNLAETIKEKSEHQLPTQEPRLWWLNPDYTQPVLTSLFEPPKEAVIVTGEIKPIEKFFK